MLTRFPRIRSMTAAAAVALTAVVSGPPVSVGSPGGPVRSPAWQPQASGVTERLRAVSAVSQTTAWASGNRGTVIRTADGGARWTRLIVPASADLDFRDIESVDAATAYVLSIGPGDRSRIFKTSDAGGTWTLQFTNPDPKAFYDALAFWNAEAGLAIGDPVDGRYTVLWTTDGGKTWRMAPAAGRPEALPGDGAFAASGTCLVVQGARNAWIGTGGAARARVFRSIDRGLTWSVADTPIGAGISSAGIFSLAFADPRRGIAVGGDYRKEEEPGDNIAMSHDGGATWATPGAVRLPSFRSGVAFVPGTDGRLVLAVGPAGTDWSADGGRSWTPLAGVGFHAVGVEPGGQVGWAVGEQGRVARLSLEALEDWPTGRTETKSPTRSRPASVLPPR